MQIGRVVAVAAFLLGGAAAAGAAPAGPITLTVDATGAAKKLFHSHEVIPTSPGPLTLYFPKWIPGEHGPTGPLVGVAGLRLSAGGRTLQWTRDLVDMYAWHCDVPSGATAVTADFDMQTAQETGGFTSSSSSSAVLAVLNWNQHVLYPAGSLAEAVTFATTLRIPDGWHASTALRIASQSGSSISFKPVSLVTLVDSPVQMGLYTRDVALNPGDARPVTLHLAADSRAALELEPEQIAHYRALVAEARAQFGARHYDRYDFLFTLSDHIASFGLEHHESSDDREQERTLVDSDLRLAASTLLPHEYTHSWNGKYRRPADLTTPDFQQPMKDDLLWVYEGLTQYLGQLFAARSGLQTPEQYRELLAIRTAELEEARGRDWRPLVDTAVEAQLLYDAPDAGAAWRRGVDFYNEGNLIWLEADGILREKSGGKLSLDDFCRRFHGGEDTSPKVVTYTREDVIATLNALAPYDWAEFFRARVDRVAPHAPMAGIQSHGWRLVYRDSSSEYFKAMEASNQKIDLAHSIGIVISDKDDSQGTIVDVLPGSAAARAGVAPGMMLLGVNGRHWNSDVLHDALKATATGTPLELLLEQSEYFRTCKLDWKGGERYPWLERIQGAPDRLGELIAPKAAREK